MKLAIAYVHSWLWHLFYGMWKGYRQTETSSLFFGTFARYKIVALTSTDSEHRIVKVFWERKSRSEP